MQALLETKAPQNNMQNLRGYYEKLEAYIRGLGSLRWSGDSVGELLIPIIINKLPSELKNNLPDDWEINDVRRGILKEINIMEAGRNIYQTTFMHNIILYQR